MQEIQLKFDPGRGSVGLSRITAVVGDRVGAMPKPTRRGYTFVGWYLSPDGNPDSAAAHRITAETVLEESLLPACVMDSGAAVLTARWKKTGAADTTKKNSLRTQRRAILVLAIVTVLLIGAFITAGIIADIYRYTDFDDEVYTIKKSRGEYALFKDGELCDSSRDGEVTYYMTALGTQLEIDPETGEYTIYAVVDTTDTEVVSHVGASQRVLMFKQLTYDESSTNDLSKVIRRIEVHNQEGTFTVVRGDNNRFRVEGHDTAILQDELFAQLSVGCGYTISMQRLENPVRLPDGDIDYSEYGLAPETREKTDDEGKPVTDENGNPVLYDYTPTWYTVTTMTGESYTVTIGDPIVSSAGYYTRYGDRDTIYILSSVNLDAAVLQPIETLITPLLVTPMGNLTHSVNVEDFIYRTGHDHLGLNAAIIKALTGVDITTIKPDSEGNLSPEDEATLEQVQKEYTAKLEALSDEDFAKIYEPILDKYSHLVTHFSAIRLSDRQGTMQENFPYEMSSDYMAGYLPNSDNIGTMLQSLQSMVFDGVTVLGPTEDELDAYGLSEFAHEFAFSYYVDDSKTGITTYYPNHFVVSERTEDGYYYAYSEDFDMIVRFAESQAKYLGWEEIDWYDREYYQCNIAHVQSITLTGATLDAPIRFTLDNSKTDQSETVGSANLEVYANGQLMDYKLMVTKPSGSKEQETATYNFRRFFQSLLSASIEGNADLTSEEMAALRETPDSESLLTLTVNADDGKGNTRYLVYRFYRYTERKAYMTVEVLETPDSQGSPANGQGSFYVLASFCDKLIADANRFLEGTEIVVDSKN